MDQLAVITGASSSIGYELARYATENGYDLIIAADEPEIEWAAENFRDAAAPMLSLCKLISQLWKG